MKETAEYLAARPDYPLWKPLGEFLDEFYEAAHADREAMLADEPVASIPVGYAAYLAASAEYLSDIYGFKPPKWVEDRRFFLDTAYFPSDNLGAGGRAICIAESPTSYRRRFIFTDRSPVSRKLGPDFTAKGTTTF